MIRCTDSWQANNEAYVAEGFSTLYAVRSAAATHYRVAVVRKNFDIELDESCAKLNLQAW